MPKNSQRKGYTPRTPQSESSGSEPHSESDTSAESEPSYHSSINESVQASKSYRKIRSGLRRSDPAAIVVWAFHKLPSDNGLSSRRVINFLKKHYRVVDKPQKTGKSIGALLRCAVEFGLLEKHGNRYYLAEKLRRERY